MKKATTIIVTFFINAKFVWDYWETGRPSLATRLGDVGRSGDKVGWFGIVGEGFPSVPRLSEPCSPLKWLSNADGLTVFPIFPVIPVELSVSLDSPIS